SPRCSTRRRPTSPPASSAPTSPAAPPIDRSRLSGCFDEGPRWMTPRALVVGRRFRGAGSFLQPLQPLPPSVSPEKTALICWAETNALAAQTGDFTITLGRSTATAAGCSLL